MPFTEQTPLTGTERIWLYDIGEYTTTQDVADLGGGGGSTTWIGLTDTDPTGYVGSAGYLVRVNATPDGLEFVDGTSLFAPTSHTHLLAAGATDVTATAAEVNLLDLAGLTSGWVLAADTASTASWQQLAGSDINNDLNWTPSGTLTNGVIPTWVSSQFVDSYLSQNTVSGVILYDKIGGTGSNGRIEFTANNNVGQINLKNTTGTTIFAMYNGGNNIITSAGAQHIEFDVDSSSQVMLLKHTTHDVRLTQYGAGTFPGTSSTMTRLLGVESDGDVVETTINNLTAKATPVTGDELLLWDSVASQFKKVDWSSLPGAGGGITSFTVQTDDAGTLTITDGETLDIGGGTGITTSSAAGTPEQVTITLADTAVTPGSYGSASAVSTFTVDQQGRLTAAGSTSISITESQISDLGAYVTDNLYIADGSLTGNRTVTGGTNNLIFTGIGVFSASATSAGITGSSSASLTSSTSNVTSTASLLSLTNDTAIALFTPDGSIDIFLDSDNDGTGSVFRIGSNDTSSGGGAYVGALVVAEDGSIRVPQYGSATFTGTAARYLAVDSSGNIIEEPVPSGGGDVTKVGTPVDNQIGVWTGDGTIEGDTALTFDTSTDTLTIGASGNLAFGGVTVLADSAGTTTLQNIDAIDATTESTIEAAIDTLSNLTSVGTITTGTWNATDIAIADGGTGASTVADARTNLGIGYVLQGIGIQGNFADATTYYFGAHLQGIAGTNDVNRLYIPRSGTITVGRIFWHVAGTLASAETFSCYVRVNDTTDHLISSSATLNATSSTIVNSAMSVSVSAGDYIEFKIVTPTWATNPTNVRTSGMVYIQ